MSRIEGYYMELELDVEFNFYPFDPGNPDKESRTCCPPSPAYSEIIDVTLTNSDGREISIKDCISEDQLAAIADEMTERSIEW